MEHKLKTGESLLIRKAEPDDAEEILEYMEKISGESRNLLFAPGELKMTVEDEKSLLENLRYSNDSVMLVGELNGRIVCAAQATRKGSKMRIRHRGGIAAAVLKEHWSKGIGQCLMNEIIGFALTVGIEQLELEVRSDNAAAIALYKKSGFVTTGKIPGFMKIDDEYFDVDIMVRNS